MAFKGIQREDYFIPEIGWEILHISYGVTVEDCDRIMDTVVSTMTPTTRFLKDHMVIGWPTTGRTSNKAKIKYVLEFALDELLSGRRKAMHSSFDKVSMSSNIINMSCFLVFWTLNDIWIVNICAYWTGDCMADFSVELEHQFLLSISAFALPISDTDSIGIVLNAFAKVGCICAGSFFKVEQLSTFRIKWFFRFKLFRPSMQCNWP